MKKNTKQLLADAFASIPNKFAYREVRFYVHQAMQRLQKLELREAAKETALEKKKPGSWLPPIQQEQSWLPPIYKEQYNVKPTLDIIDKMIADEQKKIEQIHNDRKEQGEIKQSEPTDNGDQAIYG